MEVILDRDEYNRIWTKIDKVYQFKPSVDPKAGEWIRLDPPYRAYRLTRFWDEKQEGIVGQIMRRVIREEMYALVWNSDCFIFHPDEKITPGLQYRDFERDVNVYFPSYYPDGDYYFFVVVFCEGENFEVFDIDTHYRTEIHFLLEYDEKLVAEVPRKQFDTGAEITVGQQFQADTATGPI